MSPEGLISIAAVVAVIVALASDRMAVETAMLGGLVIQILAGAVDAKTALAGFAHPAVVTIAALFVVAAGLSETGVTHAVGRKLLGRPKSVPAAQLRLMLPVAGLSALMNNTPIVAMYLPLVSDWAKRIRVSPSKLLIPLSFSSIFGGQLTLIGSASNLIIMGLYVEYLTDLGSAAPSSSLQFWGPALLGLPAAVVGIAFLVVASGRLLPERRPASGDQVEARKYTVHMDVQADSAIVGSSIEEAGLRHLPGLYLIGIERDGQLIAAPPPDTLIQPSDRLGFAGILDSVVDLRKIKGLVPATNQVEKVAGDPAERTLVEAVVSRNSPLVGRTVRGARFRTMHNAAIIAVHRNGEQIQAKVGDIRLRPGDTLLLETQPGFVEVHRNSSDFYLVSAVAGFAPIRYERMWRAVAILALLIIGLTLTPLEPVVVALSAALLMVLSGCVNAATARRKVTLQIVIVIAAALGMGEALTQSGAADALANSLLGLCTAMQLGPRAMILVMMLMASLFSQLVTKNGSAALMFPIAVAAARQMGVHPEPFVFSLILGVSLSFLSPVAYQTNLMVYGPGGYRFSDFARIGFPLTLLLAVLGALICPIIFPFRVG